MTYGDLLQAQQIGLPELLAKSMPIKAAMKVRVLARKVRAELTTYEEMREAMLEKYAEKDGAGEVILNAAGQANVPASFWREMNEVLAAEAPAIEPISVADLGEIDVTPGALAALGDLLTE